MAQTPVAEMPADRPAAGDTPAPVRPAAGARRAVRDRDRLLRGDLLRVPRPGRADHGGHRLVPHRRHAGLLGREPGRGAGRRPGRAAHPAPRPAPGDDRRQRARRARGRRDRRGAGLRLVRRGLAGGRDRERRAVLPARVRRADRLVRAAAGRGADHPDAGGRVREHDLRAAHLGAGRPTGLARHLPAAGRRARGRHDPGARPLPPAALDTARPPSPGQAGPARGADRSVLAAGRSCCWSRRRRCARSPSTPPWSTWCRCSPAAA